jgi:hypothetical protein
VYTITADGLLAVNSACLPLPSGYPVLGVVEFAGFPSSSGSDESLSKRHFDYDPEGSKADIGGVCTAGLQAAADRAGEELWVCRNPSFCGGARGDLGGPLVARTYNDGSRFFAVGVASSAQDSFGASNPREDCSGVVLNAYMNVSHYADFVRDTVSADLAEPWPSPNVVYPA